MIRSFVLFFCLLITASSMFGQTASMPKNPAALLTLATSQNGLDAPDLQPWHIKATYQTFDETGKPNGNGIFEEWWAGPKQYKRSFASKDFTQVEYVTDTGTYWSGNASSPPLAESLLASRLLSPMPEIDKDVVLLRRKQDFGKTPLDCVVLARKWQDF